MPNQTIMAGKAPRDARMMEPYLAIGNQLHDQAIVDFFCRMVSSALLYAKKTAAMVNRSDRLQRPGSELAGKRSQRIPV